ASDWRLLAATRRVCAASCWASGTSTIETEPRWSCVLKPTSCRRLREPCPLMLATINCSRLDVNEGGTVPRFQGRTATAPGYQPTGMKPMVRLSPSTAGLLEDFGPSATTATALLVPLAT